MGRFAPLGVLAILSYAPLLGQGTAVNCNVAAEPVPVRAGGVAERTSDVVVTCNGGLPTPNGQNVQPMTWVLTFGNTVTSRPLSTGWSDALLVVDEPQPATQSACLTASGLCTITSEGVPQRTYDGSGGHPNIFQSELSANVLIWRNVPFDPPGSFGSRIFRFTNLRVATPLAGTNVQVTVSMLSGQVPVFFTNSTQFVATSRTAAAVFASGAESASGRLSRFNVNLTEQFSNVLKAGSAVGPVPSPQSQPGGVSHRFETGFYNPNLAASIRGNLSFAGLPDNGTRVRVAFANVPETVVVTVPLTLTFGASGIARLTQTDANGIGPFAPPPTGELANAAGTVTAVYEITQSSSSDIETLTVPFTLAYASGAPQLQTLLGSVALAPLHASLTAETTAIPRFNSALVFTVSAPREPLSFSTVALPSGAVGAPYVFPIGVAGGVSPYTFTSLPISPAPGLQMSSTGVLSGTPAFAGTFSFSVTVRDSVQGSLTTTFSVTIGAAGSLLRTSVSRLDFTAAQGGSPPPLQTFRVTSAQNSQPFTVSVEGPFPGWLQISPVNGAAPGLVTIATDPGNLPDGSYTARLRVSVTGNPNVPDVEVLVVMAVRTLPARLESSLSRLNFTRRLPSPGTLQGSLLLRNAGSGTLPFTAAVLQRSSWITAVTPLSGSATGTGVPVRIDIDSTGLPEGIYRDSVRFVSSANTVEVPVLLRVAPGGPLLDVRPSGARFSVRQGSRTLATRDISVLNGDPVSTLNWSAEVIRGSEHFSITPGNGVATLSTPGSFRIAPRAETAALAPGDYYGLVRVTAPGAAFSPQYVVAVLQVRPASQPVDLDLDTGGLVFTGFSGGQGSRRVLNLNAATQTALPYQAAASTFDGAAWLAVSPASGNIASVQAVPLAVSVDPSKLAAGVYRGEVTVASADVSQTLPVTLFVTDAASDPIPAKGRTATCVASRLAVSATGLPNNFTVPAGWPATLAVDVRDNCGGAVANATVVARFSNGDAPMTLDADGLTGSYTGTWQPGTPLEQANVTLSALSAGFPEARAALIGSVRENKVPQLFRNGTIHNLDPKLGGLLAPGLVVQVYGTNMASVTESTGSVPLSTNYKNTSVLIGPYEAPLYYVSPGQLVIQLPYELTPNRSYPILVSANGALTVPDEIDVVAIQPGVAAFTDGKIIAQHSNFVLVDTTNPAKRGEFLIMYLVGLGTTNQLIASGAPSPGAAPLPVLNIPPTVTLDGAPVEVAFAGLTPFGVGLYQINFKVPDNARLNAPLDVIVKQGPYTANVTTLTVVP